MNKKGFTLVELLAAIVILGVILLIAIPSYNNIVSKMTKKSQIEGIGNIVNAVATTNFEDTESCFYSYNLDNYEFPENIGKLYIMLFKTDGSSNYGVYAVDNNNKIIVDTTKFKDVDYKNSATWISEDDSMANYINENAEQIVFGSDDLKVCKVIEGDN